MPPTADDSRSPAVECRYVAPAGSLLRVCASPEHADDESGQHVAASRRGEPGMPLGDRARDAGRSRRTVERDVTQQRNLSADLRARRLIRLVAPVHQQRELLGVGCQHGVHCSRAASASAASCGLRSAPRA